MSFFITLEGPDGSGKSTQVSRLADRLRALGFDVLTTREPGGTAIGQQVREILMSLSNQGMFPETEFLLFSASRAQHVREVIAPHLATGGVVISDRYADSSLAYQGFGHGLNLETIRQITTFATGGRVPDLTLLLDLDPALGLQRRQSGQNDWNRLDDMALAFHRRAREGFLSLAAAEPDRYALIDAAQSPDAIHDRLVDVAVSRLAARQLQRAARR